MNKASFTIAIKSVKTALTKEFVTGKVYEDWAEQNIVLTNR